MPQRAYIIIQYGFCLISSSSHTCVYLELCHPSSHTSLTRPSHMMVLVEYFGFDLILKIELVRFHPQMYERKKKLQSHYIYTTMLLLLLCWMRGCLLLFASVLRGKCVRVGFFSFSFSDFFPCIVEKYTKEHKHFID